MTSRIFSKILAAVPFILLVFCVYRYAVDVPKGDEWGEVHLIDRFCQGRLHFYGLWTPHGQHRVLFPRLIVLAFVKFSSWNLFYLYWFDVALAAGTFAFFVLMILRMREQKIVYWLVPVAALAVFSLRQRENWLWGNQIRIFLSVFSAMGAIFLLSGRIFGWKNFFVGLVCAIVSVFSFACGLAVLPAVFFALGFARYENKKQKTAVLALWAFFSCVLLFMYFNGFQYQNGPATLSVFYDVHQMAEFGRYYFTWLGSLLGAEHSFYTGAAGFIILIWGTALYFFSPGFRDEFPAGLLTAGIFAAVAGFTTALGRAGFGPDQALSSRYTTISYPLWIYVFVFAGCFAGTGGFFKKAAAGCLIFAAGLVIAASLSAVPQMESDFKKYSRARRELFLLKDDAVLADLDRPPSVIRENTLVLKRLRLSVFRTGAS